MISFMMLYLLAAAALAQSFDDTVVFVLLVQYATAIWFWPLIKLVCNMYVNVGFD